MKSAEHTKQQRLHRAVVKRFDARRKQAEKIFASQDGLCRLNEMQQLAQIHGGICLSKRYVDHEAKLHFRCAENHEWKAVPSSIRRGAWCGICGSKRAGRSKALTIEKMHEIAAKNGGECLSQVYKNNVTNSPGRIEMALCKRTRVENSTEFNSFRTLVSDLWSSKTPRFIIFQI